MGKIAHVKKERLELRCTPEEMGAWKQSAIEHGLSLSAYARVCLNQRPTLSRIARIDPALLRQIAAIGNNLNQIARRTNISILGKDWAKVEMELLEIRKTLEKLLYAVEKGQCS